MIATASTSITLHAGWNLVGYLPNGSLPTPHALYSIAGEFSAVMGFDGAALPGDGVPQFVPRCRHLVADVVKAGRLEDQVVYASRGVTCEGDETGERVPELVGLFFRLVERVDDSFENGEELLPEGFF